MAEKPKRRWNYTLPLWAWGLLCLTTSALFMALTPAVARKLSASKPLKELFTEWTSYAFLVAALVIFLVCLVNSLLKRCPCRFSLRGLFALTTACAIGVGLAVTPFGQIVLGILLIGLFVAAFFWNLGNLVWIAARHLAHEQEQSDSTVAEPFSKP